MNLTRPDGECTSTRAPSNENEVQRYQAELDKARHDLIRPTRRSRSYTNRFDAGKEAAVWRGVGLIARPRHQGLEVQSVGRRFWGRGGEAGANE